ncbi:MAG: hypothetical protein ACE5H2_05180 [Terriglobia bacterium]
MPLLKIYFIAGLLLTAVAVLWREQPVSELAAPAGLLALVLGLMQVYVTLPLRMKVALALAYGAGVAGLIVGGPVGKLTGSILVLLVLVVHGVGVVRFPGKAKSS